MTHELQNPRKGVVSATIQQVVLNYRLKVVYLTHESEHTQVAKEWNWHKPITSQAAAKALYARYWQSQKEGHEKPIWEKV